MSIKDLLLEALSCNHKIDIDSLSAIIDANIEPAIYDDLETKIKEIVEGYHFDAVLLQEATSSMINSDGTTGSKWTVEQTNIASDIDFNTKMYNEYDFNYIMNMSFSDFYELLGTDVNNYIKYSTLWLEDTDGGNDRAYRYYTMIIKGENICQVQ